MTDAEDRPIGTAKAAEILKKSPRSVQRAAITGAIPVLGKLNDRGDLLFSQRVIEEIAAKKNPDPTDG